jgi:hypothetical protein
MIGGSTTNGLPTYTRKYLTDLGITANFKGVLMMIGTLLVALMAGVLMFIWKAALLVGSIIVYPHTAALFSRNHKTKSISFSNSN